jgi:hypothetical protein
MANSITGINDDIISQGVLRGFTQKIAPLMAFTTDFSGDAAKRGDKVSILRDNTAIDAVQTKSTHTDYTIQDADSDAVEVSLGQPKYVSWALDDTEIASSSVLNLEVYGMRKGNKLATSIFQDIASEITNANFGAAAFTGASTAFDSDDVIDVKDACDDDDWPDEDRWLILSNAYYNALLKDSSIKSSDAFGGMEAIREGRVPMLAGFKVLSSNIIPGNSENLVGFAAHASSIACAFRYLQPQEGHKYNRAERLSDESGITLGLRDWYDEDSGVRKRVVESVYGYETGIGTAIKRLVSA